MNGTHGNVKVTDDELIQAIQQVEEPVASASELAEQVGLTRTAVNERLKELLDEDRVEKKDVGRGYVWWVSDG
jgi:predicted ArsR family transcriptional regulator